MMPIKKYNLPAGVSADRDRHGNVRYYYRARGRPKVRLTSEPGTDEFKDEAAAARLGVAWNPEAKSERADPPAKQKGTLRWLLDEYERRVRGTITVDLLDRRYRMLQEVCATPLPGKKTPSGHLPYAAMERRHVLALRDAMRETPGARNNVVKAMSAMFSWAIDAGIATSNPCIGIKRLRSGSGFHTWSVEEILQFLRCHAKGTKARRALFLALFTGLRRADLAIAGKQHIRNGRLVITPGKTAGSSGVVVDIPILPILAAELALNPGDQMTFLVGEYGRPFSSEGLGNRFRKWCNEADLPHCSLHGLRKAGPTIAAENEATDAQLMAIWGWTTKQQTTHYTSAANRRRLADEGILKLNIALEPEQTEHVFVPPQQVVGKSGTKTGKKANENNG